MLPPEIFEKDDTEFDKDWKFVKGVAALVALLMVLAVVLAWVPPLIAPAKAGEREDIISTFAKAIPSVGALYGQAPNGDLKFLCTATAIGRHESQTVVLSAHHCLDKGVSYLINFGDNQLRSLTVWKIPHYEVDAQKHPRRYNEPLTDMALFLTPGTDVPLLSVAAPEYLNPGTRILTVGFPLGVAKLTYEGTIAGRFDRAGSDSYNYLMLQVFGAPGSSGSAVLNLRGEVVGVLVSARQSVTGLPVIFATPIEYQEHLIPVLANGN